MRRLLTIAILVCGCNQPSAAEAQPPARPHPRLILTPAWLGELTARARAGSPEWKTLRARCEQHASGKVEWLDGNGYPNPPDIGPGYQGEGYREALRELALCYQIARVVDPKRAPAYAKKGVEVLERMSVPSGPRAPNPLHDDGYGIRNFGLAMALGYDWLWDQLSNDDKQKVRAALARWLDAYDKGGFGRGHPQGNYFAAWYATKALAALALDGEDEHAGNWWSDFYSRLHLKMVQPFYEKHLRGGGWPEGWNYGPLGTVNMLWPALAARSARGMDFVGDKRAPFSFPVEQARYLMNFSWPSRLTMDQRGAQHPGKSPAETNSSVYTMEAGVLEQLSAPLAAQFHKFSHELRDKRGPADPFTDMLFWSGAAREADYRSLPLSYLAEGMQAASVRSSWDDDAVWGAFTSGAYVGNPESGEMLFDQGSLTIARGDTRFLCDSLATLYRHTPGTEDGDLNEDATYKDNFGNHDADPSTGNRQSFNIFYARASHFGQIPVGPEETRTKMEAFEDGGSYVLMRGVHLEDMYRTPRHAERPVSSWTRQVTYLRPRWFVVDDRTTISKDDGDQWMAFHFAGSPRAVSPHRYEIGAGKDFRGAVTTLLPAARVEKMVDLYDHHKVWRMEIRPGAPGATQRWLTVLEAAPSAANAAAAELLSRANGSVESGDATGVLLRAPDLARVSLTLEGPGEVRYHTGVERTSHVVVGTQPGAGYTITIVPRAGGRTVTITPGGARRASSAGSLSFVVGADGSVEGK